MDYRTCDYGQVFGKVGDIFQIGSRKLKRCCKKLLKLL